MAHTYMISLFLIKLHRPVNGQMVVFEQIVLEHLDISILKKKKKYVRKKIETTTHINTCFTL